MNRLSALLLFILFFSNPSLAQPGAKYRIQNLTTENGLPSNGVKGLEWDDETGFLWIATEAGISRYNGLDFVNFTKENTPGLSHERIAFAVRNRKGTVFATDVGGNVLRINTAVPVYEALPENTNFTLNHIRHYLSTYGKNLQEKLLKLMVEAGARLFVYVVQVTDTSLAIFDGFRRGYYVSASQKNAIPITLPPGISGLFNMNNQLFAVDTSRKLYTVKNNLQEYQPVHVSTTDGNPIQVTPTNTFLYSTPGIKNPILFSDNNAWLLYDRGSFVEARLICSEIPPYSFIRFAQYSENNKTLFIGTDSKGIIVITENKVLSIKKKDTDIRELNAYYSQILLPDGNVLTGEGHVIGLAESKASSLPITGKFSFTIYTSGDSLLWFSQQNNFYRKYILHQYNYKTGKTIAFPKIPIIGTFGVAATQGRFFVATSYGLGVLETDSIRYIFKPGRQKSEQQQPINMIEFSPGIFGVASCDGLIRYDINNMTTDTVFRRMGYCVRSIWKYKDYVFFGTYGLGFYGWKAGKIVQMPLDKNKFLLYTHCIVPDSAGFCWISTNRGLFKAKLSDLVNAFENNNSQVYYHYFGRNDGMDITEMNGGCSPCAVVLKNKTISFPTMDGLLWVDPQQANPLLPEGNIYIDEFLAGDEKHNPDSLTFSSLPFKERDIIIKLGFSAWCNKENIYLEYRLDPKSEWVPVDVKNGAFIRLSNLRAGKYKLQVRKLNGFGVDNYSYKEIEFSIRTPWQQQWWFYILCILVVLGLVGLYLKFRTNQYRVRQKKLERQVAEKTRELLEQNELLEKNNTIKTRLISIISHDIVTPLKFVTVAGKNLLEKRKMMSEDMQQETINEITNTSQELQLLSTNILNWIKYQNEHRRMAKENFDLHEMVNQVLGILQSLARQKNIRIVNQVEPITEVHQFYEPLKILVYNLLTNAIQFTEKGSISVKATRENGSFTVSVTDDGIGMTPEQVQRLMAEDVVITSANVDNKRGHGLGYLIIKDLVKTMGATLHIESKKDMGTTVSVTMPATKSEEG